MSRRINAAGLELIKSFEGLRLDSYICAGGVRTIGWGSTGPHVKEGMCISLEEAETLLKTDLARFERGVEAMTEGVATSDDQFAAMVSLAFNIGLGAFVGSTVLKRHKLGNHLGASRAFLLWNKAKGQVLKGLTRRREAEAKLYRGEM
jgi:lysozyme